MIDAIELTRALIRFDTINPPGNEQPCAEYLGRILEDAGFSIAYYPMEENRANLIARLGGGGDKKPLVFSGHTDVVPLGAAPWSVAPFAAEVANGKVYGRGSTDMKGGVAAFVAAAVELAPKLADTPGLVLVITAAEERGCKGARHLADLGGVLGEAGAMVVAEPTANRPLVGHKGVLWVEGTAKGVTAHGSMPHEGVNAVYKAAGVVSKLAALDLGAGRGFPTRERPTLNVGWMHGGMNINSVPDEARIGLDIRMVPGIGPADVMATLSGIGGEDVAFVQKDYHEPVWTDPGDPWVRDVFALMAKVTGETWEPAIASYFTDASPLTKAYGHPPTLIIGPGEPQLAHQTDEYCLISRIEEAKHAFTEIARGWCGV